MDIFYHPGRKAEYAKAMFPSLAKTYDGQLGFFTFGIDRRWRKAAVRAARVKPGDRVLDLASGTGLLALEFAQAVAPNGKVTGLDITPEMLEEGRRRAAKTAYHSIVEFREGDASRQLPFPDNSFDAASMGLALRYFDAPTTIREMTRVVRPGGRVVILDFNVPKRPWRSLYHFYIFKIMPGFSAFLAGNRQTRDLMTFFPNSIEQTYTRGQLAQTFRDAGLVDVEVKDLTFGVMTVAVGRKP